jgi:exosortase A
MMEQGSPGRHSVSWARVLPLLFGLIVWILFWYRDTALAMVAIWARADTYAHAFIVPPISLWLIWRKRHELALLRPEPTFWLFLPLLATTIFWLMGELTAVNALTQFTFVLILLLAIVSILGFRISRRIAFPLGFLLFCVPVGDFMVPTLMEWTAWFTVLALRATGIPAYQEGMQFIIPSGKWSVVEACSGIRYVIASVTVGTLFAYLNYVSLRRRLIFIGVSIIVPVIANWLRAYIIVMLGHLSGNKVAAGVDHLIYGWLFFGIVIAIMFIIGARWSEVPPATKPVPMPRIVSYSATAAGSTSMVTVGIALAAAVGPLAFVAIEQAERAAEPILAELTLPPGWSEATPITNWKPAYANTSFERQTTYSREDKSVGLYVGYYRDQDYQRKLVTSTNVLVTSSDPVWSVVSRNRTEVILDGVSASIRTAELLRRDATGYRLVAWQWYWIDGKLTSSDVEAKLLTAISRLRGRGDDSAVVILYTTRESAKDALPAFAMQAIGPINQMLDATRAVR